MINLKLVPEYALGKNAIVKLKTFFVENNVKKVSLVYGGGSIKQNSLYDDFIKITKELNLNVQEINGIQPNPLASSIWNASIKIREFKPDYIVAAGGGSVIDATKVISILAVNPKFKSVEEYFEKSDQIDHKCIPLISILTLSGTGSENNAGSVVTFEESQTKKAVGTPSGIPVLAIEDPVYTFTVSPWQTASGSFDCFSHLLEQYYVENLFDWTKEYLFANMRNVLKYGPIAFKNPNDYTARKNLMFTSSMSLNAISNISTNGDWNVHVMEHAVSGKWDVSHGAGLALITPSYIKYRCQKDVWFKQKTIELGKQVMHVDGVDAVIDFIVKWIETLKLPKAWLDFSEIKSFNDTDLEWLLKHLDRNGGSLTRKDYETIFRNIPIEKNV